MFLHKYNHRFLFIREANEMFRCPTCSPNANSTCSTVVLGCITTLTPCFRDRNKIHGSPSAKTTMEHMPNCTNNNQKQLQPSHTIKHTVNIRRKITETIQTPHTLHHQTPRMHLEREREKLFQIFHHSVIINIYFQTGF